MKERKEEDQRKKREGRNGKREGGYMKDEGWLLLTLRLYGFMQEHEY